MPPPLHGCFFSAESGSGAAGKIERHPFEFDHVFGAEAGQEEIFEEVSQLVQVGVLPFINVVVRCSCLCGLYDKTYDVVITPLVS